MKKRKGQNKKAATISKRFFAYLIDWYLSGLLISISVIIFETIHYGELTINNKISLLPTKFAVLAGILGVLLTIIYFYIPQLINKEKYQGQSLGKIAMKIRIEKLDGSTYTFWNNCIRFLFGMILIEQTFSNASFTIRTVLTMLIKNTEIASYIFYIGVTISVFSIFLVLKSSKRQAIHDIIAKTQVIEI